MYLRGVADEVRVVQPAACACTVRQDRVTPRHLDIELRLAPVVGST